MFSTTSLAAGFGVAKPMKLVTSAGGQVVFSLPDDWSAWPDGNGQIFQPARAVSGALRLDVLTVRTTGKDGSGLRGMLAERAQAHGVQVENLQSGFELISYIEVTEEDGVPITTTFWELQWRNNEFTVLPIFSFTIETDSTAHAEIEADLEMLHRAIRKCQMVGQ